MSRRPKGPRLYLRAGRTDNRTGRRLPDTWYIRDGPREISTGCGIDRLREAEGELAVYIAAKWCPPTHGADRPNQDVLVAEVLALYAQERAPELADPSKAADFIKPLLEWWAGPVAGVKRSTCKAYVAHRTSQSRRHAKTEAAKAVKVSAQTARRELEVLSSAIGWWHKEHPLPVRPEVWLPEKPESPRDALTRGQAAALLKASMGWRLKPAAKGEPARWVRLSKSAQANRAHVRRFILLGIYAGSRPGVATKLLWHESPAQAWVDVDAGVIYRRGKAERDHRTKRRPLVRIPGRLLAHMRRWREADQVASVAATITAQRCGDNPPPPITSVIHHGSEPLAGRIRRGFAACVADAGLDPEITPHWLRHTCATWLMQAGAPLWDAAAYTGMTAATLEKCYGHHRPDHQHKARKALGGRAT